jgi:hypothetical protein
MTTKEQVLKLIEGRIETMQQLSIECIELIYNAGYNEAIDDALKYCDDKLTEEMIKLKKQ